MDKHGLAFPEDKGKILGVSPAKPRVQLCATGFGQPFLWAERKNVGFWKDLLHDINAGMVVDCTPGSGTAARAALELNICYYGIARNSLHANSLSNVARVCRRLSRPRFGTFWCGHRR